MTSGSPAGNACLWRLSAALAGPPAQVPAALERAAARHPGREIEEVLLQAYLFLGFPAVIEAFDAWRALEAAGGRGAAATAAGTTGARGEDEDPAVFADRGRALCARVYGSAYPRLRDAVRALHPDLDRWMVRDGYGKVLSRPGLDSVQRELCIVALLAADDRPRQLHSHLRGALNVGARPDDVGLALETGLDASGRDPRAARELWDRVRKAWLECS